MKQNLTKWGVKGFAALSAASPLFALAQRGVLPVSPVNNPNDAVNILCTIAGWMFTFLIVLAVIFVIYAAFTYLTAAGNQEKVTNANHMLIYAVVAIAVAIIAKGVPGIIGGILTTSTFTGCP